MRTKLISVCLLVFLCFSVFICACGSANSDENTDPAMKTNASDRSESNGFASESAFGEGASNQSDIDSESDNTDEPEIDTVTGANMPSDQLSDSESNSNSNDSTLSTSSLDNNENNNSPTTRSDSNSSDSSSSGSSSTSTNNSNNSGTSFSADSASSSGKNTSTQSTINKSNGEPIDIIFVCGQSNAAGMTDQPSGYGTARAQSIACDADQIYSSYVPLDDAGASISGINGIGSYVTKNNVSAYISNSVGSTTSLAGTTLAYPPYALSVNGNGKTGMDSAIAYEWNQLTGRKVWIVNSSYSGSAISTWAPGQTNYETTADMAVTSLA